jgi:hypothetical protein
VKVVVGVKKNRLAVVLKGRNGDYASERRQEARLKMRARRVALMSGERQQGFLALGQLVGAWRRRGSLHGAIVDRRIGSEAGVRRGQRKRKGVVERFEDDDLILRARVVHPDLGAVLGRARHARAQIAVIEAGDRLAFVFAWKSEFSAGEDDVGADRDA